MTIQVAQQDEQVTEAKKIKDYSNSNFAAAATIAEDPSASELMDQGNYVSRAAKNQAAGNVPQDMMNAQFDSDIHQGQKRDNELELQRIRR